MDAVGLLEVAIESARRAGDLLLRRFGGPASGVETKATPTDPVSDADRDAEAVLVRSITSARPDDGLVGEEGHRRTSQTGLTWVIDPLDGTVNFLYGIPAWCVSVAVADADGWVAGVVHDPNRAETFTAARGSGAALNGARMRVTDHDDLATALVATGFSYVAEARTAQLDRFRRVLPRVRDVRRLGSAALDLAWLAAGRFDGYFEAPMMEWDRAAGTLLVTEAGGVVSELPSQIDDNHGVIAAGPRLHDPLRRLVLG